MFIVYISIYTMTYVVYSIDRVCVYLVPILISLISNIEPDVVYLVVGCVSICFILISPISIWQMWSTQLKNWNMVYTNKIVYTIVAHSI